MTDQEFIRQSLERQRRDRQEHNDRVNAALNHAKNKGINSSNTPRPASDATGNPRTLVPVPLRKNWSAS